PLPLEIPISLGYKVSSLLCSVANALFDGSFIFSQLSPFVLKQLTTIASLSSTPGKYNDTLVPTCGMQYIIFPVSGRQSYKYSPPLPLSISNLSPPVSLSVLLTSPSKDIPLICSL